MGEKDSQRERVRWREKKYNIGIIQDKGDYRETKIIKRDTTFEVLREET